MKTALIISVVFQLLAAVMAFGLTKQTKFNISWIIISVAFLLMAARRILELISFYNVNIDLVSIDRILGIVISVLLVAGVVFIRRLFNFLRKIENIRIESENRVLQAIVDTEERERRQFARDLHDGIGPLLSNIKMSITALDKNKINGFNKNVVDNINNLISESISALKNTSNNLSPHILESFGLISALKAFIDNISMLGKLDISFSYNIENIRFDEKVEINLYRVICELFQNTIKHAEAANISLMIHFNENRLVIQYLDDGKGFDPDEAANISGMGLSNMQSRLKAMHGQIEFKRIMPKGMMISVILKIKPVIKANA